MKSDFPKYLKLVAIDLGYQDDIYKATNADGTVISAMDAKLIELLSHALDFRYTVKHLLDNTMGVDTGDGNWSGIIGSLQRGESDLIVDDLTLTSERQEVVDFSYPYYVDDETFVTSKPKPVSKALVIFYPFSLIVWILLFVFLVIFCLVLNKYDIKKSKTDVFISLVGNILGQYFRQIFRHARVRLLLLSWIVGITFLSHGYKATLLSFLSFPIKTGVRNIAELSKGVEKESYICVTYKGSYLIQTLKSSDDNKVKTIGKSLEENSLVLLDAHEVIESSHKKVAFIYTRSFLIIYDRSYFVSKDSFHTSLLGVAVGKRFCCKKALDKAIFRIWETGLYDKIVKERRLSYFVKDNWTEPESRNVLNFNDTYGAFIVFIVGHMIATITFILEIIIGRLQKT